MRTIQIYVSEELTGAHITNRSGQYIQRGVWIGYYDSHTRQFSGMVDPEGRIRSHHCKLQGVTHWAELLQPPAEPETVKPE